MHWHNKGVYCKWKLSAGDSSLKSQFWTEEWTLWKVRIIINFTFFLPKVQNVPPSMLILLTQHGMGHVWTLNYFSKQEGLLEILLSMRSGWEHHYNLSGHVLGRVSWVPLAMTVLLMGWNLFGWESMLLCWIPPFSIWTWNLFAILQGCFLAFLFQWCKSCLFLPSP